jgi:formylglycine-generating enzyme required for sulfatase activity
MEYSGWLTKSTKSGYRFYPPSEEEWEWAAGGGKREYPWGGKKPNKSLANYGSNVGQTTPVGSYPEGATPEGLMDMAGNVWEWTNSIYEKNENLKVLRGGSFYSESGSLACSFRRGDLRSGPWHDLGFRVACSSQSGNLKI